MNVVVRAGAKDESERAADRAFVRDLGKRSAVTSLGSLRPAPEPIVQASFEQLCEIVEGQSSVTFIAQQGTQRVGFLLLFDGLLDEVTSLPQGFVAYMAVERGHRRNGVGSALLSAAEAEARRRGLPYIALMVTEQNAAARALYERHGYETERRLLCKPL